MVFERKKVCLIIKIVCRKEKFVSKIRIFLILGICKMFLLIIDLIFFWYGCLWNMFFENIIGLSSIS